MIRNHFVGHKDISFLSSALQVATNRLDSFFFKQEQNKIFTGDSKHFIENIEWTGNRMLLGNILFNPPPHRQHLQLRPDPSWRSFSWHGLGVHHRMETSGRSQCASGCPGEPQRRGCSPPACGLCKNTGQWLRINPSKHESLASLVPCFLCQASLTRNSWHHRKSDFWKLKSSAWPFHIVKGTADIKIARGAIPCTLPGRPSPQRTFQIPSIGDCLWAMSTDKVYGFDTELTLLNRFYRTPSTTLEVVSPLMKEEAFRKISWDPPNTSNTFVGLIWGTLALTECASGGWGHGHGGCSWQVPAWRPESAVSSPKSPQLWGPRCNRVSSYPRQAHRSSPDVWARHFLDNHNGTSCLIKGLRCLLRAH